MKDLLSALNFKKPFFHSLLFVLSHPVERKHIFEICGEKKKKYSEN